MSNVTFLPPGSGPDQLRTLLRHLVALPASADPFYSAPAGERFAMGTTRGRVRERNEDRVAVARVQGGNGDRPWMLLALCDGMGGMVDGARAAELALSTFVGSALASRLGATGDNLRRAAIAANIAVEAEFHGKGGATLSAIAWDSAQLVSVNAGDSRIWSITPQGRLTQWTRDDSIAAQLAAQGVEGAEDARRDLLQFIGIGEDLRPHIGTHGYDDLRFVVITSDGAHDAPPTTLARILHHASGVGESQRRLIDLSLWLGGLDNASVLCWQPAPVPAGAPGVVELWVQAGYWRIVRPEQPNHGAERAAVVSSPPPRQPESQGALKRSDAEPRPSSEPPAAVERGNSRKTTKQEKPATTTATGKRARAEGKGRPHPPLFDDERPSASRVLPAPGETPAPPHVEVRIGSGAPPEAEHDHKREEG